MKPRRISSKPGINWSAFTGRLKDANAAVARSYRAIGATPPPVTRVQIEAAEGISEWVEWAIAIPSGIAIEELLLGRQFRNAIISRWSKSPGFKTWAEVKFRGKFTRGKILGGGAIQRYRVRSNFRDPSCTSTLSQVNRVMTTLEEVSRKVPKMVKATKPHK